uniref:class III poly(R)-hydroxyalkanoic acid synthase subunit PhaC n=1 Tax=Marinobacterium profundum TaxID=1714300 RepID=UPI0008367E8B|nr:class III poly(R)-hydroxyalkanoic acid synthase subunit PhaC [Marinobacterium profundum]
MKGIDLDPDKVCEEVQAHHRKLVDSCKTLTEIRALDVGPTPCEVIYRQDKLRLLHYVSEAPKRCQTPLLICYALVNRPYVLDLDTRRSLVQKLLVLGIDLYLLDWGYPDAGDSHLDLDDYINDYLDNCVDQVRQRSGHDRINLLGICQGGTFSLCYSAIHGHKIRNLITLVTPVDFHTPDNLLSHLAQKVDADLAVETYGNIPGSMLNDAYQSLMPMRLGIQKQLRMPDQLQNRGKALNFLRMEKWIHDSPDQAGEAFRQFIQDFFQQNKLVLGQIVIGDKAVDLHKIHQPLLNIYGEQDHLVPPSASTVLADLTSSSDYEALPIAAGHIGIFVGKGAQNLLAPHIAQWLLQRDG